MFPKWLWSSVVAFSFLEWVCLPFIAVFTEDVIQVVNSVFIIAFIVYPVYFIISVLFLPRGAKRGGMLILLIPLLVYAPLLLTLQLLVKS